MNEFIIKYDSDDYANGVSILEKIRQSCILNKIKTADQIQFNVFDNAITHRTYRSQTIVFYGEKLTDEQWETDCLEHFINNLN